jgi:hypothetical protein
MVLVQPWFHLLNAPDPDLVNFKLILLIIL